MRKCSLYKIKNQISSSSYAATIPYSYLIASLSYPLQRWQRSCARPPVRGPLLTPSATTCRSCPPRCLHEPCGSTLRTRRTLREAWTEEATQMEEEEEVWVPQVRHHVLADSSAGSAGGAASSSTETTPGHTTPHHATPVHRHTDMSSTYPLHRATYILTSSQVYLYSTFHMAYIDTMCFEWRDDIK